MGMVVRSNIMALNANRQLGMNNSSVGKSLEKLSSGFRINRAGDDASGLAISEKMKAQIKGLETASANSQDGISLIQTAEGNLTEVHDMLNRMVELAEKSANGTMEAPADGGAYGAGGTDRDALQAEMDALSKEIDRIADSANFNNIKLLDGSLKNLASNNVNTAIGATGDIDFAGLIISEDGTYMLGDSGGATAPIEVVLKAGMTAEDIAQAVADAYNVTVGAGDASVDGTQISSVTLIDAAGTNYNLGMSGTQGVKAGDEIVYDLSELDVDALQTGGGTITFNAAGGSTGSLTIDPGDAGANVNELLKKVAAALSADPTGGVTGIDVSNFDISVEGDKLILTAKAEGPVRPGGMVVIENGGGTQVGMALGSKVQNGLILQIGDTSESFNKMEVSVDNMHMASLFKGRAIKDDDTGNAVLQTLDNGSTTLDISSQKTAGAAMTAIKKVINTVSTQRANLGALQNRLEHTINNLDVAAENMSSANSRIRDTDMAKQMMDYTKMNVLTQAAQAMLAQANQQPQSVLQLLQ